MRSWVDTNPNLNYNMKVSINYMTVEEVKEEVMILNPENIQHYPCPQGAKDDFRFLWSRCGPQAGRDVILAAIYNGKYPRPSEIFGTPTKTNV